MLCLKITECFKSFYRLFINVLQVLVNFSSLLASGKFCRLLITFAKSLNPDQDRKNVSPDLDANCLTL